MKSIRNLLQNRILVLDGAMGTMIQSYKLKEDDYRGIRFQNWDKPLKGHNDLLCLTQPKIIYEIHEAYLKAGADIIETNTFNANAISLADYGMQELAYELNYEGAKIAKAAASTLSLKNKPRFVAGSIGPTNKTASVSPDVNNPAYRDVTFDLLVEAYYEQAKGLMNGGVDVFLVETIFDTLNAKAAIYALQKLRDISGISIPVMASATIADMSGRSFTGQTIEALYASLSHIDLLSFGFNCAFGANQLLPFVKELDRFCQVPISLHPNAGLPDALGNYTQDAFKMSESIKPFLDKRLINIIGGCCGTSPKHIKAIADLAENAVPRPQKSLEPCTRLSGLEALKVSQDINFVNIGERSNVSGSKMFARLIKENKFEKAVAVTRKQVEAGAQIVDICMDDALIDAKYAMRHFLNLLASEPDISRVPFMIDSSNFEVLIEGLKCCQGKPIVNSISLKNGEKDFIEKAKIINNFGASILVMLFDEKGQADSYQRKIEIAQRSYNILTKQALIKPENIIIDPNVLAIGTGMKEHANYAVDFIEACRWIKQNLPYAKVSGGISNLSFAFRGNERIRQGLHTVFLYHAINAGLDMGIVNPEHDMNYETLDNELKNVAEDLVLNRSHNATESLLALTFKDNVEEKSAKEYIHITPQEALQKALLNGVDEDLSALVNACLKLYAQPAHIIDHVLMPAMDEVGERFGTGKLFLPQVIKSARIMKKAVAILEPHIAELQQMLTQKSRGKILLATVKGDVHDIGKNIVGLVLACNGFDIIDIGVMVPPETIVSEAFAQNVDMVALSGLITPSLEEMTEVARQMEEAHLKIPLLIGGATTSKEHTALKIANTYSGIVAHVKDASESVKIAVALSNETTRGVFKTQQEKEYERIRSKNEAKNRIELLPFEKACENKFLIHRNAHSPAVSFKTGIEYLLDHPVSKFYNYLDWSGFIQSWDMKAGAQYSTAASEKLIEDARNMLEQLSKQNSLYAHAATGVFYALSQNEDVLLFEEKDATIPFVRIPFLRNQRLASENPNHCLSDFVMPVNNNEKDCLGMFALTVGVRSNKRFDDDYQQLLIDTLSLHLAEAFSDYLHERVFHSHDIKKEKADKSAGIRPAIGYPSCPDHSLKAIVFDLLNVNEKCAISLTENYAMKPTASVCGFYFFNKAAQYFNVGKIDEDQLHNYSKRRGIDKETLKKLLVKNIKK